ncbi:DUF881 domain-containing protein [Mycolicibacterium parafortuitum]|uniref:Uncharacterized protein n=1 Tax=Mycolicibacterium parafortuitum TaxID=39692 RepID=A0A375YMU2_MYCPF|nr:DUF881 domain-containing protein [Mycolicibacterium parafortuitum]ORB29777.1 hypothetical protein BST38_13135 [Mycolicibacterium parafortuitum]SRX82393.1 hypothetical protein MPP7335_04153 [Mycolicibacterium parafortuitum]
MSTLGGYDSSVGRAAHQANAPTRIPVPSLLRSLLTDHLDPGYAAAAQAGKRSRASSVLWQVLAAVVVATVFALAWAQARDTAPGVRESQRVLAASVHAAQAETDEAAAQRATLSAEVDAARRSRLAGDTEGRQLLAQLDDANYAAAATPVIGSGLTVTVTDPGMTRDLTDVSKQRVEGSRQVILDRDLQLVVNALWAGGAEAISVGGVRIGPNVTIRQAGGGILVDNQPVSSPYVILAVGPPNSMADDFNRSAGLQRLRLLETSYGVGVNVSSGDGLVLPAGSVREINFARQIGP